MDDLNKRIIHLRKELMDLETLKAHYEANPMLMLQDEVSYMRAQKNVSTKEIIDYIINHVKTYGSNQPTQLGDSPDKNQQ